jgi:hypothetical protein
MCVYVGKKLRLFKSQERKNMKKCVLRALLTRPSGSISANASQIHIAGGFDRLHKFFAGFTGE